MSTATLVTSDYFNHITLEEINNMMRKQFPELYSSSDERNFLQRTSHNLGKITGKTKNFFSKTETKVGVLVGYWAADALIALALIFASANMTAIAVSLLLLVIHTYATFSVIGEISR